MKLLQYRKTIDEIDAEIFALLEKRFAICDQIGEYKKANGIATNDSNRENEILASIGQGKYKNNIEEIYKTVFLQSKILQQSGNEK